MGGACVCYLSRMMKWENVMRMMQITFNKFRFATSKKKKKLLI